MSGYKSDLFVKLLTLMDQRTNRDDEDATGDENTIQDLFFPISDKLTLSDTVTVSYYTPSTMVWGNGLLNDTCSSRPDWFTYTNVVD